MPREPFGGTLALGGAAAIFIFAVSLVQVFEARSETGDLHPVFSSLRADPSGTKALFESLERLPGMDTERRFEPLEEYRQTGATIVLLGFIPYMLTGSEDRVITFEEIARRGNRLVIGLPVCVVPPGAATARKLTPPVIKRWAIGWECVDESQRPDRYVLTFMGGGWTVLARDSTRRTLVAERREGTGSIVLVGDSYAFSNEALLRQRETKLLADVLGPSRLIIFDEHHLGLVETEGVMSLARRYRLHGLGLGLLLLALLFIWRNAIGFLPLADETGDDEISGRDTASGLASVLRRSIPPSELISICAAEWKRTAGRRSSKDTVDEVMAIAAGLHASREPVKSYQVIAHMLNDRRTRW